MLRIQITPHNYKRPKVWIERFKPKERKTPTADTPVTGSFFSTGRIRKWNGICPNIRGEALAYFMTIAPLNSCKGHPRFITFNKQHNFELELSLNVQVVVSGELAKNLLILNFHRKFRYPFRYTNLFSDFYRLSKTVQCLENQT